MNLPPLPEPVDYSDVAYLWGHTESQLKAYGEACYTKAYGEACYAKAIEDAAKACSALPLYGSSSARMEQNATIKDCIDVIYALLKGEK